MIKTSVAALLLAVSATLGSLVLPTTATAQVELSVMFAPPPLPVYEQPPLPAPGWIWTPGYWYYGPYGYYWVPGTWVQPPAVGLFWTPGYWGWSDGLYVWSPGYWAPQVGFYGGVNYGFGYFGHGYEGGYWRGNRFWYNREVTNVTNVHIENIYTKTVVNNVTVNRVSYVGGPGGVNARPTTEEEHIAHQHHTAPTAVQVQHREIAAARPELVASVNHGKPAIAATAKPTNFESHVSATAAGGPVTVHARDLPKLQAVTPASKTASTAELDSQRQEAAMQARQQQERDSLAQMQERDHAYLSQQNANARMQAAVEHQHRQQTQLLQQRQASEMQSFHAPAPRAQPPAPHAPPPPPPRGEPPRR
jgi:WXXGXW repeat (2 copies)